MGKIFMIIGRSGTGKDTIYKNLIADRSLLLNPIVTYTTRPKRPGEQEGVEYHFVDEERMRHLDEEKQIVEKRCYHTKNGDWYYFTVDNDINLESGSYLTIGTLDSFMSYKKYFAKKFHYRKYDPNYEIIYPIYLSVPDDILHNRLVLRENESGKPDFVEMNRRFSQDSIDFSTSEILKADIDCQFENINLEDCIKEIRRHINFIQMGFIEVNIKDKAYINPKTSQMSFLTKSNKEVDINYTGTIDVKEV